MTNNMLMKLRDRAIEQSLPYAGAATPQETFEVLKADQHCVLIDVRTQAERDWVGRVDIPEEQHFAIQWSLYPEGKPNPDFMTQLSNAVSNKNTTIFFLCRSGVRSRHGAKLAAEHGYVNCFDILQGFEGDRDAQGHRKTIGGWCSANLPWVGA